MFEILYFSMLHHLRYLKGLSKPVGALEWFGVLGCVLLCTHKGARKQVQSVRAPLIRLSKQTGNGEDRCMGVLNCQSVPLLFNKLFLMIDVSFQNLEVEHVETVMMSLQGAFTSTEKGHLESVELPGGIFMSR